ncbi:MAG: primosomal protein N' [Candidatus Omnitrophica bacterium]|nr:primosomal protein N' [Candidatus Omnitrophota bacterium]
MPPRRFVTMYVQVVFGLPLKGPFDYQVPKNLKEKIKSGKRVEVNFRNEIRVGYIVGIKEKTEIKTTKSIIKVLDEVSLLDKHLMLLTKRISDYYGCYWGEAIEAVFPLALRKLKVTPYLIEPEEKKKDIKVETILLHDLDGRARWERYIYYLKETLDKGLSCLVLFPDLISLVRAKEIITDKISCSLGILHRRQTQQLKEWLKIKEGRFNVVIGLRSAILVPLKNLGLIIIDEEQNDAYKQNQVPYYHAREVAFMRARIEKIKLILSAISPSLETMYLVRKKKIKYEVLYRKEPYPKINIIDLNELSYPFRTKEAIPFPLLQERIISFLNKNAKVLIFLNRTGFATLVSCRICGTVLKCPRCNVNLIYHLKEKILNCHYCNFKMLPPQLCPQCNSGYIRYRGLGTEKMESELARIFPQAKIKRLDSRKNSQGQTNDKEADIFISTQSIIKQKDKVFNLVIVLGIDNVLNRVDFRSAEKAFVLLLDLLTLSKEEFFILTCLPNHYCFSALKQNNPKIFFDEELKQRRQLEFPPYRHLGLVKIRGEKEKRVDQVSKLIFKKLSKNRKKDIKVISVSPSWPAKLRGKFWWQILCSAKDPVALSRFLKTNLRKVSRSGIILTVDIDPL